MAKKGTSVGRGPDIGRRGRAELRGDVGVGAVARAAPKPWPREAGLPRDAAVTVVPRVSLGHLPAPLLPGVRRSFPDDGILSRLERVRPAGVRLQRVPVQPHGAATGRSRFGAGAARSARVGSSGRRPALSRASRSRVATNDSRRGAPRRGWVLACRSGCTLRSIDEGETKLRQSESALRASRHRSEGSEAAAAAPSGGLTMWGATRGRRTRMGVAASVSPAEA